jgi:hypothetical protein
VLNKIDLESGRYSRLLLLTLFLIALSIRLGAVLYLGVPDIVEAEEQGLNAARLVNGQGYTFEFYGYRVNNPLQSFKPPLYTFFLAFFLRCTDKPALALGVSQAFLSSLACIFVYGIATTLSGKIVGLLSSAATAVYPVFVIQSARPFSVTLHTLLLSALVFLVLHVLQQSHFVTTQPVIASEAKQSPSRKEEIASSQKTLLAMTRAEQLPRFYNWAIIGILVGLLALGRPSMLGLLPGILLWVWLNRRAIANWHKAVPVIVLFTLLTILPWTIRNYHIHHQIVPISTHGGFTFWNGNNPFTTGSAFDVYVGEAKKYAGIEFDEQTDDSEIVDLRPYPLPRGLETRLDTLTEVELDRALYLAGLQFIRENPRQWLKLEARKVISFWWFRPNMGKSRADLGEYGLVYDSRWIMPYKILYAGVLFFFLAGIVLSVSQWRVYSLFYFLFLDLTVVYVGLEVITRYRWEIEPFMVILATTAVLYIVQRALPVSSQSPAWLRSSYRWLSTKRGTPGRE